MIFIKWPRDTLDANSQSFPRLPHQARLAARSVNSLTRSQVYSFHVCCPGCTTNCLRAGTQSCAGPAGARYIALIQGGARLSQHVLQTARPPPPASTLSRKQEPNSRLLPTDFISGYKSGTLFDANAFRGSRPGSFQWWARVPWLGGEKSGKSQGQHGQIRVFTCRFSPSCFSESECCCRRFRHSVLSAESRSTISLSRTRI